MRASPDKIVFLAAFELDDAEARLFPPDTIAGDRIADSHFSASARMLALILELAAVDAVLLGRIRCAFVDDEGAVPALVEVFIFVVEDVGVEIIESRLPGFVFRKERVAIVLLDRADRELCILYALDNPFVQQEKLLTLGVRTDEAAQHHYYDDRTSHYAAFPGASKRHNQSPYVDIMFHILTDFPCTFMNIAPARCSGKFT